MKGGKGSIAGVDAESRGELRPDLLPDRFSRTGRSVADANAQPLANHRARRAPVAGRSSTAAAAPDNAVSSAVTAIAAR